MAPSLKATGSWAEFTTDAAITIPGTPAAGDRMYLFVSYKPYDSTCAVAGWTDFATFADGTTGSGNGTGSCRIRVFYRDWVSGDGNPTVDVNTTVIGAAVIQVWQKTAGDVWSTPAYVTAAHTTWTTSAQTTGASSTVAVPNGCAVMGIAAVRDDTATFTRPTTGIDVASGITWNGNYVESPATHFSTTTGNDYAIDAGYRLVTTGATVTLRMTATLSAADTGALLWIVQNTVTPENHNSGTNALTGGGVIVEVGSKQGLRAAGLGTGGGVAAEVGSKGAQRAAALGTGGGVLAEVGSGGRTRSLTATGGGILSPAKSGAHVGSFAATGGGIAAAVGSKGALLSLSPTASGGFATAGTSDRLLALAATGGGTLTWDALAESVENHDGLFTATGGGSATLALTGAHNSGTSFTGGGTATLTIRDGHASSIIAATGGGITTIATVAGRRSGLTAKGGGTAATVGTSGRLLSLATTGGGTLALSETSAHRGAFAETGSGSAILTGTRYEAHSGSFTATGKGLVVITAVVKFNPPKKKPSAATGGIRYALPPIFPRRRGAFRVTGGGQLVIVGEGDWNDDDLVLEMIA